MSDTSKRSPGYISNSDGQPIFKPFEVKNILRNTAGEELLRRIDSWHSNKHATRCAERMRQNGIGYGNNAL